MLIEIVTDIKTDQITKTVLHQMASIYQDNLPDSLYLNQYQLAEQFGFTARQWNEFLKVPEVDLFIEQEVAQIAEIGARKALAKLISGDSDSSDIQAAREILSKSKLIQQRSNQKERVIILRIPNKGDANDEQ